MQPLPQLNSELTLKFGLNSKSLPTNAAFNRLSAAFNSACHLLPVPAQVGVDDDVWRMIEKHLHQYRFSDSGRDHGPKRVEILTFLK